MTLPHQTGLAREVLARTDSVEAAEAHARGFTYWSPGRFERTAGNVIRLVLLVIAGVAAVVGVVVSGFTSAPSPYSVDTTTPRGALGAYFQALSDDDVHTAVGLICRSNRQVLIDTGFVEATAGPLQRSPMEPWPVILWDAEPRGDDFVIKATNGESSSAYFWVVAEGDGAFRVCGFA
jgi:hypothetical protein